MSDNGVLNERFHSTGITGQLAVTPCNGANFDNLFIVEGLPSDQSIAVTWYGNFKNK